jgi:hypothetical protein
MIVLLATLVVLVGLGILLVAFLRGMYSPATVIQCDLNWLAEFSTAKYRPMARLLSREDFDFLAQQDGFDPSIARRLRRERRLIFRGYLRNLVRDYHRLHLVARQVVLYSETDASDLAAALVRHKFNFAWNLLRLEIRLALHSLGIGSVDVRGLLGSMESLQQVTQASMRA